MMTDTPEIVSSLTEKFESVYEFFAEFRQDLGEMHEAFPVHNDVTRVVFSSLSRLTAYADQVQLILTLMCEDIGVIDELTTDPATAAFSSQIERCFNGWPRNPREPVKVH